MIIAANGPTSRAQMSQTVSWGRSGFANLFAQLPTTKHTTPKDIILLMPAMMTWMSKLTKSCTNVIIDKALMTRSIVIEQQQRRFIVPCKTMHYLMLYDRFHQGNMHREREQKIWEKHFFRVARLNFSPRKKAISILGYINQNLVLGLIDITQ